MGGGLGMGVCKLAFGRGEEVNHHRFAGLRIVSYFRELLQTLKSILYELQQIHALTKKLQGDYESMHRAALRRY